MCYCSESQRCSALLEDAVHVLLCCLEMVEVDPATTNDYLAWEVQEGIKCAYFLRRIYEEVFVYYRTCINYMKFIHMNKLFCCGCEL